VKDRFWTFIAEILRDLRRELPRALDEKYRSIWNWYGLPREERLRFKCCGSCRWFRTLRCPFYVMVRATGEYPVLETDPPCDEYVNVLEGEENEGESVG